jgi:hypothetical protein
VSALALRVDNVTLADASTLLSVMRFHGHATNVTLRRVRTAVGGQQPSYDVVRTFDSTRAPSSALIGRFVHVIDSDVSFVFNCGQALDAQLTVTTSSDATNYSIGPLISPSCHRTVCFYPGGFCNCLASQNISISAAGASPCFATPSESRSVSDESASSSKSVSTSRSRPVSFQRIAAGSTELQLRKGTDGSLSRTPASDSAWGTLDLNGLDAFDLPIEANGLNVDSINACSIQFVLNTTTSSPHSAETSTANDDQVQQARLASSEAFREWIASVTFPVAPVGPGLGRVRLPSRLPPSVEALITARAEPQIAHIELFGSRCYGDADAAFVPQRHPDARPLRVTYEFPSPTLNVYPPPLEVVAITATVAAGLAGSPGAAKFASRASSISSIASCRVELNEPLSLPDSPTGASITDDPTRFHFGAVVTNAAFVALIAAVNVAAGAVRRCYYLHRFGVMD